MRSFVLAAILAVLSVPAWAGDTAKDVNPDEIIKKFAAKEAEFARARENYTYRQTVKIQTLSDSGVVDGRYEIVEDIIFSRDGKRTEKVVRAPVSTLTRLMLTPEDLEDLRNVQPFVLTTNEIPQYDIRYLGPQKADEIPCYVFAVKPKKMEKGHRYFEGQIDRKSTRLNSSHVAISYAVFCLKKKKKKKKKYSMNIYLRSRYI